MKKYLENLGKCRYNRGMKNENTANMMLAHRASIEAQSIKVGCNFMQPSRVVRPAKVAKVEKILKFFIIGKNCDIIKHR